ncbi:hypothetical protein AURDEDRAFT_114517 [Auricularia subglabra TFB-10046 SS5]|nr:hypothetical protein AURDEDRAFT_114517 [Auricularia subglabra TFB-10046 SS5]
MHQNSGTGPQGYPLQCRYCGIVCPSRRAFELRVNVVTRDFGRPTVSLPLMNPQNADAPVCETTCQ